MPPSVLDVRGGTPQTETPAPDRDNPRQHVRIQDSVKQGPASEAESCQCNELCEQSELSATVEAKFLSLLTSTLTSETLSLSYLRNDMPSKVRLKFF